MASIFRSLTHRSSRSQESTETTNTVLTPQTSRSNSAVNLEDVEAYAPPHASLRPPPSTYHCTSEYRNRSEPSISGITLANDDLDVSQGRKGPPGLTRLHSPQDPKVDIIFVHGLGGDPFKTWCVSKKPDTFWPKKWLPREPGFENVRIWTWGYESYVAKGDDVIHNIHHFGKALVAALQHSPDLFGRRREQTKIITVGHSMGGLVMKKAFILACQDANYQNLASRFRAMVFLATPHYGAAGATMLATVLQSLFGRDRRYIKDLAANSDQIQVINDGFRHYSERLTLTSFYETQKSKFTGGTKKMIVDPENAVLGYPGEKQMPLDADHRGVCKFENREDRNYMAVRNALSFTLNQIATEAAEVPASLGPSETKSPEEIATDVARRQDEVRSYLGVGASHDHDHVHARDARLPGSCEWMSAKEEFLAWRDGSGDENRFLWLHAQPGSGKTVLAGYIIDHLMQLGRPCAHWYFKFADHKKSGLAACLKSVVYQMAKADPAILEVVADMKAQGIRLDDVDSRQLLIYLRQFNVFTKPSRLQYWVIDSMDECSDIFPLLDALRALGDASLNIRILFTSRLTRDLKTAFTRLSSQISCTVASVSISPEDTAPDLRKMIDFHLGPLDILEPDDPLIDEIIETSKGSLLWASVVLHEAIECDTVKELRAVLNAVPDTMDEFYERSLAMMSKNKRRIPLLRAVLRWACCAYTPLTLPELQQALNIELDDDYVKIRELIETNCGQLVTIDASGGLNVIHKSAGDYLTSGKENSELCLNLSEAHASMACICLSYLTGDEMKPPRSTEGRDLLKVVGKRTVFHTYASTAFSYHMSMTSSAEPRVLDLLEKFLSANVLSWIETSAGIFGLNRVTDAGEHFNAYLQNCQAEDLPVTKQHQELQEWAIDLGRLVGKFGHVLIASPSSIFGLIPPISPSCSMIHNIAPQTKTLSVVGKTRDSWDDRLVSLEMGQLRRGMKKTWDRTWEEATSHIMDYYPEAPMNLAYGEQHIAVSVPTETQDTVRVYNATSHELEHDFVHGEIVVGLQFDPNTGYLAVAGVTTIRVVNVPRKVDMYVVSVPECPMCFDFFGSELRAVGQDRYIYAWRLGDEAEELPSVEHTKLDEQAPLTASMSVAHQLLALGYPDKRIDTWDLVENVRVSSMDVAPPKAAMILCLEIQPNSSRDPIIVSYWNDRKMALMDPFAKRMIRYESIRCHTMKVSPDGRFIAAGLDFGIAIHDFDTLSELYMVRMAAEPCCQLRFSRDGKRLADTRGTNCIVWEPAILSLSDPVQYASLEPRGFMFRDYDMDEDASVMAVHPTEDAVFCGTRSGDVVVYSRKTPHVRKTLYKHKFGVELVKWCHRQQAVLSTASREVCLQSVSKSSSGWEAGSAYSIRKSMNSGVDDALASNGSDQFILASKGIYYLHDLNSGDCREFAYEMRSEADIRYLAAHPRSAMHVVSVDETEIRIHHWTDWSLTATIQIVPGPSGFGKRFTQNYLVLLSHQDEWHLLEDFSGYFRSEQYQPALCIRSNERLIKEGTIAPESEASLDSQKAATLSTFGLSELEPLVRHAIGVVGTRLVFLDKFSWICSYDMKKVEVVEGRGKTYEYSRHFCVPAEWLMPANWYVGRLVVCAVSQNDLIFACMGGITVVRNFMQHSETVHCHRNA